MKSGKLNGNQIKHYKVIAFITFLLLMGMTSLTIGQHIMEGKTPQLGSYITVHFAGYLFFLTLPVEALVPYYLSFGHNMFLIFGIAMITALLAQAVDYAIGYLVPKTHIKDMIGKNRYEKATARIRRHRKIFIFVFNLFPLSSPILILCAGIMKVKFKEVVFYSSLGLAIKYYVITYVYNAYQMGLG